MSLSFKVNGPETVRFGVKAGSGGSGLPTITKHRVEQFNGTLNFAPFDSDEIYVTATQAVEIGLEKRFYVTWDGVEYECKAFPYGLPDTPAIGNEHIIHDDVPDTGEPFLAVGTNIGAVILTNSKNASHNIVVELVTTTPVAGSSLVVVDGEWKAQDGYAYRDGAFTKTFERDLLPGPLLEFDTNISGAPTFVAGEATQVVLDHVDYDGIIVAATVWESVGQLPYPLLFMDGREITSSTNIRMFNATANDITPERNCAVTIYMLACEKIEYNNPE